MGKVPEDPDLQVGNRLQVYYEYQSTVSVEMKFTDSVDFPAVTICNQNSFRFTVVVEKGMYEIINELYESDNISSLNMSKFDLGEITDMEEFVRDTAHQLEDFIDSCTWYGESCDLDQDFEVTLTDIGVCYTFNSSRIEGRLKVTEPGSQNGLQLILNVEHYEYMRGPQADVGVKVLLHEPGEVPMMKDKGFAAAPGTHTLVAVKRSEVYYEPYPYSDCVLGGKPASNCFQQCHTQIIQKHCGCRDVYMPEVENDIKPVCDFSRKFQCIDVTSKAIRQELRSCYLCETPCMRVTFEPRLSYGQLSRFNIDRLVLSDPNKERLVQSQFRKATESSQRVIDSIASEDKELMDSIMGLFVELGCLLMQQKNITRSFGTFAQALNYPDILVKAGNFPELDARLFEKRREDFASIISNSKHMEWNFYDVYDFVNLLRVYLNGGGTGNVPIKQDLETCVNSTRDEAINVASPDNQTDHIVEANQCNNIINKFKKYFNCTEDDYSFLESRSVPKLLNLTADFRKGLMQLFDNTSFLYEEFPGYMECSEHLNVTVEFTNATFHALLVTIGNMLESNNTLGVLSHVNELSSLVSSFLKVIDNEWTMDHGSKYEHGCDERFYYQYGSVEFTNCTFFLKTLDQEKLWSYIEDAFVIVKQTMFDVKANFLKITENSAQLCDIHSTSLSPVLAAITSYQNGNITKLELANIFDSTQALRAWTQVSSLSSGLKTSTEEFDTNMNKIKVALMVVYQNAFAFSYPILSNTNFTSLLLFKEISQTSHQAFLNDILEEDHSMKLNIIQDTLENVFSKYEHQVDLRIRNIANLADSLLNKVDGINEKLELFWEESRIDWRFYMENFLRLDIYYPELSYQFVKQVPAFELLSLLSQVGGFLGLLLGASLLTVCELVDYLGLKMIKRWHRNKTTTPVQGHLQ